MTSTATEMPTTFETFRQIHKDSIENTLIAALSYPINDSRKTLQDAMIYSLSAKAKRIRPLLCLATQHEFHKDSTRILPLACAIEMIHTYSLIHDDLPAMDNDDFRRGRATCHKVYGEDFAVLAGDTLNTFAFEYLAHELPKFYDPTLCLKVIAKLAKACGIDGMSGGQAMDLLGQTAEHDANYLRQTHARKTGALLSACFELPAILEGADNNTILSMAKLGNSVGLLFQMVDDLLDATGTTEELGKTANKDAAQDKLTYTQLYGIENTRQRIQAELNQALALCNNLNLTASSPLKAIITYICKRTY